MDNINRTFKAENHYHDFESMEKIDFNGDNWVVLSKGVANEKGETLCHLGSTTRAKPQRNGFNPIQMRVFVNL